MKTRKIPMRRCLITREQFPKGELTRVVCDKEKQVSIDITGKKNGRGAYLKLTKDNVLTAKKRRVLEREFEVNDLETIYNELLELANE